MTSELKKLVELIETLEHNLENLDPASKEYSDVVDNLNVLYKLKLENERVANEHAARTKKSKMNRLIVNSSAKSSISIVK